MAGADADGSPRSSRSDPGPTDVDALRVTREESGWRGPREARPNEADYGFDVRRPG